MSYILLAIAVATAQPRHGHHDHPKHADSTYDFIIVGGGTSGLVVANRLTEDPSVSVLVVEYGYLDNNGSVLIPYNANFNNFRDLYNITSTPLKYLNNEPYPLLAAATVGGGSVVNGMFFDRASALDYDAWEALGNPGWGWKGLLPYFIKSTNFTPPSPEVAAKYKYTWDLSTWGSVGPVHASLPPFQWPGLQTYIEAFRDLDRGIEYPQDGSDGSGVGVFWVPSSQDPTTQTRSDAKTGYYDPVANRTNLHLITATKVNKILFQNKTAIGIQMTSRQDNTTFSAHARKEVILAAGPVFSPNVLHLSGIGPKTMLQEAGIEVIYDLPGVGFNLQDHATAYLSWNLTKSPFYPTLQDLMTNTTLDALAREEYFTNRTGPYTLAHGSIAAFLSLSSLLTTNITSLLSTFASQNSTTNLPPSVLKGYHAQHAILLRHLLSPRAAVYEMPLPTGDAASVVNSFQKPFSRGSITLNTTHPFSSAPIVDYNTLSSPIDALLVLAGFNFTREYFSTPTLAQYDPVEVVPGGNITSDGEVLSALTQGGVLTPTFAHLSCACAMMPEALGGVVSSTLEVHGVQGLRVVDASVMPMIPATHLCATVYAVAEKAADLIKGRYGLR